MALVVAIEGISGGGKTTLIKRLMDEFVKAGRRVDRIDLDQCGKDFLFKQVADGLPYDHPIILMCFWILRLRQDCLISMLHENNDVIFVDRHFGSTIAVDHFGHGVPMEVFDWIGSKFSCKPDVTILLDVAVEVAGARKTSKTMQDIDFAERVARGFRSLAESREWFVVDATRPPEEVAEICLNIIKGHLDTLSV